MAKQDISRSEEVEVRIAEFPFALGGIRAAYRARVRFGGRGNPWKPRIVKEYLDVKHRSVSPAAPCPLLARPAAMCIHYVVYATRPPHFHRKQEVCTAKLETNGAGKFLATEYMKTRPAHAKRIEYIEAQRLGLFPLDDANAADIWSDPKWTATNERRWFNLECDVFSSRGANGQWHKWTDNVGKFAEAKTPELLKFSKWTHQHTSGFAMVTDLQGVETENGWVLTDPAILCTDLSRFGPTHFRKTQMVTCMAALEHSAAG